MPKSLQFALAAGSMLIFASTAMAQHATVRVSPLFEVQPQINQEYPDSILPSMTWRAPVMPHASDTQTVVPFEFEQKRPLDHDSKPH